MKEKEIRKKLIKAKKQGNVRKAAEIERNIKKYHPGLAKRFGWDEKSKERSKRIKEKMERIENKRREW